MTSARGTCMITMTIGTGTDMTQGLETRTTLDMKTANIMKTIGIKMEITNSGIQINITMIWNNTTDIRTTNRERKTLEITSLLVKEKSRRMSLNCFSMDHFLKKKMRIKKRVKLKLKRLQEKYYLPNWYHRSR